MSTHQAAEAYRHFDTGEIEAIAGPDFYLRDQEQLDILVSIADGKDVAAADDMSEESQTLLSQARQVRDDGLLFEGDANAAAKWAQRELSRHKTAALAQFDKTPVDTDPAATYGRHALDVTVPIPKIVEPVEAAPKFRPSPRPRVKPEVVQPEVAAVETAEPMTEQVRLRMMQVAGLDPRAGATWADVKKLFPDFETRELIFAEMANQLGRQPRKAEFMRHVAEVAQNSLTQDDELRAKGVVAVEKPVSTVDPVTEPMPKVATPVKTAPKFRPSPRPRTAQTTDEVKPSTELVPYTKPEVATTRNKHEKAPSKVNALQVAVSGLRNKLAVAREAVAPVKETVERRFDARRVKKIAVRAGAFAMAAGTTYLASKGVHVDVHGIMSQIGDTVSSYTPNHSGASHSALSSVAPRGGVPATETSSFQNLLHGAQEHADKTPVPEVMPSYNFNIATAPNEPLWQVMERAGVPTQHINDMLNDAASKLQEQGHAVKWHGSGASRWLSVDGKSDSYSLTHMLQSLQLR